MSSVGGQAGSIRRTFGSQKLLKTENVWLLSEWAGGSHAFRLMRAEMVVARRRGQHVGASSVALFVAWLAILFAAGTI